MQNNGNVNGSVLDLSEMRPTKVEKEAPVARVAIIDAIDVFQASLIEAMNLRHDQMQKLAAAAESKIQPLPGQTHPAQDIQQRLQFLDSSIRRFKDMINAGRMILKMDDAEETNLCQFPSFAHDLEKAKKVLVDNKDKLINETTREEGLLMASFGDLYINLKMYTE